VYWLLTEPLTDEYDALESSCLVAREQNYLNQRQPLRVYFNPVRFEHSGNNVKMGPRIGGGELSTLDVVSELLT
jgi:hypothetical protein